MAEEIYQKLDRYLNKENMLFVIMDSFNQEKLASFLNKIGIDFPGMRLSSLQKEELAFALTEEAYTHREIMEELVKTLNKYNQDEIDKIKISTVQEVKRYIGNIDRFIFNNRVGNVLWALLSDERKEVNGLIKGFMNDFYKLHKRFEGMRETITNQPEDRTGLEGILRKEIENYVHNLEEEARENSKVLQRLREEKGRLDNEISKMQERIRELQRTNGQLTNDKGILKKENERLQRCIEDMRREIIQLKEKLQTAPKAKLASELHHIERENKKLLYELEKERGYNKVELERYASENKELRQRLNELQIMTYRLEEELGIEKQRVAGLTQKTQVQVAGPSSGVSLHKGRRLGIFVDGQNVYYSARLHYGKKVDYKKLILGLSRDRYLVKAVCYIIEQPDVDQEKFISMLRYSGYTVKTRSLLRRGDGSLKANWDVGMATDIINEVEKNNLDIVVMVTCDGDFVDLVKLLKPKGVRVEVAGFPYNTAMELKNVADEFYPIEEDVMLTA